MKKDIKTLASVSVFTILMLALVSCEKSSDSPEYKPFRHDPISETFDEVDKPVYETRTFDDNGTLRSYELMFFWNYDKDYNADRSYPLMINVHYSGSLIAGKTDRMQDYPCFCLNSAANKDWTYAMVAELVPNIELIPAGSTWQASPPADQVPTPSLRILKRSKD